MVLASNKVMDALKGIGLNLYERKIWVALLARGTSTAGELSEIANVPRSRSYDILQSLAEKGFVVVQNSKPLKYVTINPKEALDRAKIKIEEDMKITMERIEDLKSSQMMKELASIFGQGMNIVLPEDLTGSLKGKYAVNQQLNTMLKTSNKRVNILTTQEGLTDLVENHYNEMKKASDRGVKIQITSQNLDASHSAVKGLSGLAEIRSYSKEMPISGRFAVADGKEMIFSLTDQKVHETQHVALWSRSEHAAGSVLEPMFKMVWENSKKL